MPRAYSGESRPVVPAHWNRRLGRLAALGLAACCALAMTGCPADDPAADDTGAADTGAGDTATDLRASDVPDLVFADTDADAEVDLACTPECEPGTAVCSGSSRISYCDDSSGCPLRASPVPCPDGQGCRDGVCGEVCVDGDGDGYTADCDTPADCDDERSDVYPGAPEVCDERDNNCDRRTDENFVCDRACTDECDADARLCAASGLGYVVCEAPAVGCRRWSGTVACPAGRTCQEGACVEEPTCDDRDGDEYGPACDEGTSDCRPYDGAAYPGATERCDGVDGDCDGDVDEDGACGACPSSTPPGPRTESGGVVYGAGCGELEYADVPEVSGATPVVLVAMATGPVAANLGGRSGAEFSAGTELVPLGLGAMAVATGPLTASSVVRVDTDADAWWVATAPEGASDAAYEPNDAPAAAANLGDAPVAVVGTISAADRDYYAVSVPAGGVLAASLAFAGRGDAAPALTVLRNGVQVAPSFAGEANESGFPDGAHTFFRFDAPGDYSVGVTLVSGSATVTYALALRVIEDECADDAGDDAASTDDFLSAARALAEGDSVSAVLCPGDYDVYDLGELSSGDFVSASLATSGAGNLDGRILHDGWSGLVQEQRTDGAGETFANNISRAGRHYLVIYGSSALDGGAYTLSRE